MVSVVAAFGLLAIIALNTAIAAVMTRFFRMRLDTQWGSAIFTLLLVPLALLVSVLVLSGALRLGADVGGPTSAIVVGILLPGLLGVAIDLFWMPPPDEIEVPERV